MTDQFVSLVFHNEGLRSYIEVDLCARCPRQDEKGCCAHYSPVFYPTDFAYLLLNQPQLIERIFAVEHPTILDASVTANHSIDGDSFLCAFHSKEGGCVLPQQFRESICRHFVCSGIAWWQEESLKAWKDFYDHLNDYEIELNQRITYKLMEEGLTLRNPASRTAFFEALLPIYLQEIEQRPTFFDAVPASEGFQLKKALRFGLNWEL